MLFQDILRKKREGESLCPEEIAYIIREYTHREIPEYQLAALLMAICCRGMSPEETALLTREMLYSGKVIRPEELHGCKIDKHSTGGVGDKITLVLAPLVASLGVKVPMLSGRGLGHTGGTLDKLESIPGFRTNLSLKEFKQNVEKIGVSIIGPTKELVPADKRLYALRDITATVESIPLITASILSKKFAEGIDGLVLDVKTGNGSFMEDFKESLLLAESLVETSKKMGKLAVALISDMNQPLGKTVGNAIEVQEAVETLQGDGPTDVVELTMELGYHMLKLAGLCRDKQEAREKLGAALKNGNGLKKFKEMITSQGGKVRTLENFHKFISKNVHTIPSPANGYISTIDTFVIGQAAVVLGAGRKKLGDKIDPSVGLEVLAKLGAQVEKGQPLVKVFYRDEGSLQEARNLLLRAYRISPERPPLPPLIYETLGPST